MRNQNLSHEVSCVRKVPVRGSGEYLLVAAFPMQFALSAVQQPNGAAAGEFHQQGDIDGTWIDIRGRVTCLAVDEATGRAWIGGVVTSNQSDADLHEPIHQPGQDVWFRLVDYAQGSGAPADRLTFLGFTGGGGTSAGYRLACGRGGRPWRERAQGNYLVPFPGCSAL